MQPARALVVAAATLFVAATCAGQGAPTPTASPATTPWQQGGGDLLPIPVSSEVVVGENRFLLRLVDQSNESLADPGRGLTMRLYDLAADASTPAATAEATFLPTLPGLPGLYRAQVSFDRAGEWGLEAVTAEPDGGTRSGRMIFSVRETGSTPAIGARAPSSATPTAETAHEIALISTDRQPEPDFYRTSVDQALAGGQPFLLIFATPAFCQTATCGPALDIVKSVAPDFRDRVEIIHVEPFELQMTDGHLQPVLNEGQLVPVESVLEWGLLSEPYIFVVEAHGTVVAKLEGIASAEEIRAALEEVAAD